MKCVNQNMITVVGDESGLKLVNKATGRVIFNLAVVSVSMDAGAEPNALSITAKMIATEPGDTQ